MSKHVKFRLVAFFVCAVALTAAYQQIKTENVMVEAAKQFVAGLTAEQKAVAIKEFGDSKRTVFHFVPDNNYEQANKFPRPGLTYKEMTSFQRRLADGLLGASLSQAGFIKAVSIMSLEEVLRIAENDTGGRRDPEKYYFNIFGEPGTTGAWSWRIEGHHFSANFTMKDGNLVSSSPTFFGANPHQIMEGSRAGLRPLGREEDLARSLMQSLSADQQKQALIQEKAYRDIVTGPNTRAVLEGDPQGLQASTMNDQQFETLMNLVAEYARNVPPDVAAKRLKIVEDTPRDRIHFAWAGTAGKGEPHYYRVQTPAILIEYDNVQNGANHTHTVWRSFEGDWGLDVLSLHHRLYDHGLEVVAAD